MSDLLKKRATWAICSWLLIFGERPEQFAHITHEKRGNEWIARFFMYKKRTKNTISVKFFEQIAHIYHEQPERIAHGHSFVMSDLRDSLTVALLTWATWAIPSQLLICLERSERMSE